MSDFIHIRVFQNTADEGKGCWYAKYVGQNFKVRPGNETENDWLVEKQFNRPKIFPPFFLGNCSYGSMGYAIILKRDCIEIKDEIQRIMIEMGYHETRM
jgi:hypothetical protein